jgi:hypothetical protein
VSIACAVRALWASRQRVQGQGLVEWGMMAAILAIVGAIGFNALAVHEHDYLADLPTNSAAPSAPGSILHPTATVFASTPSCPVQARTGTTVMCTATVTDTYSNPADRNPPWGVVNWYFTTGGSATQVATCALPHITAGATNTCTMSWTPATPSAGTLLAKYELPQSNHLVSQSPPGSLTLLPYLDITNACNAPLSQSTSQVEMGHPVVCIATIKDHFSHTPVSTSITWTSSTSAPGAQLFNCFTSYPVPSASPSQAAASYTMLQGCSPPTLGSYSCTTDVTFGTCGVVFRLDPTNSGDAQAMVAKTLTIQAATDPLNAAPPTPPFTITRPLNGHPVGFSVGPCTGITGNVTFDPLTTWPVPARTNRTVPAVSIIHVHGGGAVASAQVSCQVVVADTSLTAAFDGQPPACTNPPNPPVDPCNIDYQDSYPPFGQARIVDAGSGTVWGACGASGLTWSGIHGYMPPLVGGEPEYSSSCQMILNLSGPVGTDVEMGVVYDGEGLPFPAQPHLPVPSPLSGMKFKVSYEP